MTNQPPTDALRLVPIDMQIESILHDLVEEVSAAQRGARVKARARQCCARGAAKNALLNLLAAAPASPLPGGVWRTDFENAPDCEEGILIVDATKISPAVGTARFIDGEWCGYDHGHGVECLWPSPTHWMPLPAAPTGEAK